MAGEEKKLGRWAQWRQYRRNRRVARRYEAMLKVALKAEGRFASTELEQLANQIAEAVRELSRIQIEASRRRLALYRDRRARATGQRHENILSDEERRALVEADRRYEDELKEAWGRVGAATARKTVYEAARFQEELGKANRAVGAATIVVAGLLLQVALQDKDVGPWFGWGFLWAMMGISAAVLFYFGRATAYYSSWWKVGSAERFKAGPFSYRRGVTAYEIVMFMAQFALLGMAVVALLHGLQVPGFRSWP